MTLAFTVEGSGPEVVLLHPIGLDHSWWAPVSRALAPTHRVLAVSAPGHGGSPPLESWETIGDVAAQVAATIDHVLGEAPVTLVGVSYGGMLAQQVAIDRPDRCDGLVLSATGAAIPPPARPMLVARGEAALANGMSGILDDTVVRWFGETPDDPATAERARRALLSMDPVQWARTWSAMSTFDATAGLSTLHTRALVVHNTDDRSSSIELAQALQAAISHAGLTEISGGHLGAFEHPQRFVDVVLNWLDPSV